MADLGFDGSDGTGGPGGFGGLFVGLDDTFDFCAIPKGRSGPVAFDHSDGLGEDLIPMEGPGHGPLLAAGIGGIDAFTSPIAAYGGGADEGMNGISISEGIVEAFEHKDTGTFAEKGAVGVSIESAEFACRRHHSGFGETHKHEGVVKSIDATGEGQVCSSGFEFVHGKIEGGKGAGAGSVEEDVSAFDIEAVGDAPGDDIGEQAGEQMLFPPGHFGEKFGNDGIDFFLREAAFEEGFSPDGSGHTHACDNGHVGHADGSDGNDGAVGVECAGGVEAGVAEGILGRIEGQELGTIEVGQDMLGHAELSDIEGERGDESANGYGK